MKKCASLFIKCLWNITPFFQMFTNMFFYRSFIATFVFLFKHHCALFSWNFTYTYCAIMLPLINFLFYEFQTTQSLKSLVMLSCPCHEDIYIPGNLKLMIYSLEMFLYYTFTLHILPFPNVFTKSFHIHFTDLTNAANKYILTSRLLP